MATITLKCNENRKKLFLRWTQITIQICCVRQNIIVMFVIKLIKDHLSVFLTHPIIPAISVQCSDNILLLLHFYVIVASVYHNKII